MSRIPVKTVRLLAGAFAEEVVGVVTAANAVSSMSERLADKLHIKKLKTTTVRNFPYEVTGYLPERAINVVSSVKLKSEECVLSRKPVSGDKVTVPVAFVIIPSPFNELVLGSDWIVAAGQKLGGSVVVSTTDDKPGNHLYVDVGQPSPGPSFVEGVDSNSHLLVVNEKDYAELKELVKVADGSDSFT